MDLEERRKERLAYVGISLANVLPTKDDDEKERQSASSSSSESESSSGSSSGDDSEPIYQLRQRRQAHSYRFNDYDELINSAIQVISSNNFRKYNLAFQTLHKSLMLYKIKQLIPENIAIRSI